MAERSTPRARGNHEESDDGERQDDPQDVAYPWFHPEVDPGDLDGLIPDVMPPLETAPGDGHHPAGALARCAASCETITTPPRFSVSSGDQCIDEPLVVDVETRERLVEQEEPGPGYEQPCRLGTTQHAV